MSHLLNGKLVSFQGTLCGAVMTVDCCLKNSILKGRFHTKYISPSQVLIKDIVGEQRVTIHSSKGFPVNEIKVNFPKS